MLLYALFKAPVMWNLQQLKAVQDAANLTANLLNFYRSPDAKRSDQLRLLLALIPDPSSMDGEERSLIDRLIAVVYPNVDLLMLHGSVTCAMEPPEHVSVQWIIGYLEVSKSTFYKEVNNILLFPVKRIGNRPYFLKSEVVALMVRHQKGAWTYSKLAKTAQKKVEKK